MCYPIDVSNEPAITRALLDFDSAVPASELFPTIVPEAAEIVAKDPYAHCIAACLDRGINASIIWTIPYDIKNDLGHLDPFKISQMSLNELANLFARLPRRPRYRHFDAMKTPSPFLRSRVIAH